MCLPERDGTNDAENRWAPHREDGTSTSMMAGVGPVPAHAGKRAKRAMRDRWCKVGSTLAIPGNPTIDVEPRAGAPAYPPLGEGPRRIAGPDEVSMTQSSAPAHFSCGGGEASTRMGI